MRLICFIFLLFFSSCKRSAPITHFHGIAHTHSYHIQLGGTLSEKEKKEVIALLEETFDDIDSYYNRWNPLSELSVLNRLPRGETMPLSYQLIMLIQKSEQLKELTQGHFDPTLGATIALWKQELRRGTLPTAQQKQALLSRVELDLDGLVKGYGIDQIIEGLQEKGYENIYVEWGGDIRSFGHHPTGRSWQVSFDEEVIPLDDLALATSGDAEQHWMVEGKRFSHIIVPSTKEAIHDHPIAAISVRAPTATLADALATALMTFQNANAAFDWLESHDQKLPNCTVWFHGREKERLKWSSKH